MDLDFHDLLLTPSDVLEHVFCGRFTYFERHLALPEFQERRERVKRGRELHGIRELTNRAYLRKRLGVVDKRIDVTLASPRHHLRGRLDELLFFQDGTQVLLTTSSPATPAISTRPCASNRPFTHC